LLHLRLLLLGLLALLPSALALLGAAPPFMTPSFAPAPMASSVSESLVTLLTTLPAAAPRAAPATRWPRWG
jgi:hypothetical protein